MSRRGSASRRNSRLGIAIAGAPPTLATMPLYDFACAACGKVSEILVRSSEEAPRCPHCGSSRLSRELPTFNAQAKGKEHVHSPACGCGKPRGGCGSA